MHLLHLARRLRFRLELTRVKRCVITLGSLTTVQPRQSRGQGGWTAWTRVLHIQNKLQVVQMVGCKQHNSSYEHIFLHYRCTILLDALGPLDAPRYSNHCKWQHDTRVWTQRLCAGVFVVYHFCLCSPFLQAKWGGCSAGFKAFSRSGRVLEAKRKREELQVQQEDSFAQED